MTALERRLRAVYKQAEKDIRETIKDFNIRFMKQDALMLQKKAEKVITEQEYKDWLKRTVFRGELWDQKVKHCADILTESNRQAMNIIYGKQIDLFAEGMNFQAYELEKNLMMDVGFTLYSRETVSKLIKDQPELLPRRIIKGKKDKAWNRKKISNIITEGIIEGKGIPGIAQKLEKDLTVQNNDAAVRYARTATTSAQNSGRMEMLKEAEGEGIKVKKMWRASLDSRTRDAHQDLDGQIVPVDEPFTVMFTATKHPHMVDIMYPGDPNCDEPGMVWNCRCTLEYVLEGFERNGQRVAYDEEDGKRSPRLIDGNITYREWKRMKGR